MTLDLKESKDLCDWLIDKGLGIAEAAEVLYNLGCDDNLGIALVKVFEKRRTKLKEMNEKCFDWTVMPIPQRV